MQFVSGLPIKPGEFGPDHPEEIKKKKPFVPRQKQPRDRNDWLLSNGSQDQARESARLARQRLGERDD